MCRAIEAIKTNVHVAALLMEAFVQAFRTKLSSRCSWTTRTIQPTGETRHVTRSWVNGMNSRFSGGGTTLKNAVDNAISFQRITATPGSLVVARMNRGNRSDG
jgi:hypothetical protein